MDENQILQTVEKYLNGELSAAECTEFEQLRSTNPEVDQLAVSHSLFLQSLHHFSRRRELKHQLHEIHHSLAEKGRIRTMEMTSSAKVINFWKRYKRTITIAASIAGITALCVNLMTTVITPQKEDRRVQELVKSVNSLQKKQNLQDNQINNIAKATKVPADKSITGIGTCFLIDVNGLLVTNAHVVRDAKGVIVTNHEGIEYSANIIYDNVSDDIAILKIVDKDFDGSKIKTIPYGFKRQPSDISEPVLVTPIINLFMVKVT